MVSKMTALVVVCVTITSIFILATQGDITITSEPEAIVYDIYVTLTCHIGTVTDDVKWIFNGVTYFSCVSPYGAGQCFINTTSPYRHHTNFDVNTTSGISTVRLYTRKNRLEGLWTCRHGRDSSKYNVNPMANGERARITSFTSSHRSSNVNVGTTITLTCNVSNKTSLPVNVSISSVSREGNLTFVTSSSTRIFATSTRIQCTDFKFFCTAYNGYFDVDTRSLSINLKCPVKLLLDKTNTTVNATVGSYARLKAYYSGYPVTSYTWYRRQSQVEVKMYRYRVSWSTSHDGNRYIYLRINKVRLQDAGQYSVHINATGKVFIVVFTVNVNPVMTSICKNSTIKTKELSPATTQPFISAAGLGIGIAVGVKTTLLVLGLVLLVSRTLKSRGVKDKKAKSKSTNKVQHKNKSKPSDYDNTACTPSEDGIYENLHDGPDQFA